MTSAVQPRLFALLPSHLRVNTWTKAVAPFAILLAWTCLCRLPFVGFSDDDEYFFSLVGNQWLHGNLPYVTSFDIKPPGIFAVFATVQLLFGASLATIKGIEIAFTAFSAFALFQLLNHHVSRRSAWLAAALCPVYSLLLSGTTAVNIVIQLPFLIVAFDLALLSIRGEKRSLHQALLAGVAIGCAGMIKQTAIFEAMAIFAIFPLSGLGRRLPGNMAMFAAGAGLPAVLFGFYFLAAGHFAEMFEAVVRSALARTDIDVLAAYGVKNSFNLTFTGAMVNGVLLSSPLVALWGGALIVAVRLRRVTETVPSVLVISAALWLLSALTEAAYGRVLCTYYLIPLIPPLLVLAAVGYCHGLSLGDDRNAMKLGAICMAATALPLAADRVNLFSTQNLVIDYPATKEAARRLRVLGLSATDHLLVLARGYNIYLETGATPASRYFHATHLLTQFHTPSPDPLGEALNARPPFIVLSNPDIRHVTVRDDRIVRLKLFLSSHYRLVGTVNGSIDRFFIYKYAGS